MSRHIEEKKRRKEIIKINAKRIGAVLLSLCMLAGMFGTSSGAAYAADSTARGDVRRGSIFGFSEDIEDETQQPGSSKTDDVQPADTEEAEAAEPKQLIYNGSDYTVTVTYAPESLPDDVSINVKEIRKNTKSYNDYLDQTKEAVRDEGSAVSAARFFDISFTTGGFLGMGRESVEPALPVDVKVDFARETLPEDGAQIKAIHLPSAGASEIIDTIVNEEPQATPTTQGASVDSVAFTADSFSVYGIIYTVDFWYGDYSFSIYGESEILVSEVLSRLGMTDVAMADVVDVRFSDESLLKVEKVEDENGAADWLLTSLAPFQSEEKLEIELQDGQIVEIRVTDAQNICKVYDGTTLIGTYTTLKDAIEKGVKTDGKTYSIKMIVPSYTSDLSSYNVPAEKKFILTTASVDEGYSGAAGSSCVINTNHSRMIFISGNNRRNIEITLENIVLDAGYSESSPAYTGNYGGFIKVDAGTGNKLTLNSGAILRNNHIGNARGASAVHGGAIDMDAGEIILNPGCLIDNCHGTTADDAGAIHTHAGVTITMNGGTISNCSTGRHGGAICIEGANCVFNMKGGTIENCSAGTDGGAIQVFRDATFNMSGGTITGCSCNGTSGTYGGAIAMAQKGTIKITGGTIEKCTAKQSGGAIYLGDGAFSMENATLSENKSENGSGGLIYITNVSSAVNIKNCVIEKCTAPNGTGGVFMLNGTGITLSVDSTTFSQNKAKIGGIVHLQANSTITIDNSIIDACEATVVDGGAIKLASGTIDVKNSEIKNCKAKTIGGAVWAGGGKLTLEDSKVDNCSAATGGGVYLASGSNVYIKGTTEVTNCTGSGLYLAQSTTTQLHFSGAPQVKNNDINVNMTQITTTQDSQFTNIVSAENLASGSDVGLNITNSKYDGAGELFGKTDQPSANVNLTGFKNDVNTPLVGWPVTYGQAGNSYWVTTISINAKLLTFGVESDIEGSEGIFAPDRYQGSNIDTAQVSGLATAYAKMNTAVKDANSKCNYPASYAYAYAKIGDTEITSLHYTESTGVWTYDIKNGASGVAFDRTTPVTLYYYVNPAPVKVKWVVKEADGSFSPLGNGYSDGTFSVGNDNRWYDANAMYQAYGKTAKGTIVVDKYYFRYFGLGKSTDSSESSLSYTGLSDFQLRNSSAGLLYITGSVEPGTAVAGMDTTYLIYSTTPPAGSTYFDIVNNTEHDYKVSNLHIANDTAMYNDRVIMIEDSEGHLSMFNGSNCTAAAGATTHLVLLGAAGQMFNLESQPQGVSWDEEITAKISNKSGSIKLYNGHGLYNTKDYITGNLAAEGETVTVTLGDGGQICKITDASGKLLYKADGSAAVYKTLKEAFADISNGRLYTTAAHDVRYTSKDLSVKMLVENYDYNEDDAARLTGGYKVTLTTAEVQSANTDGYYFPGTGNAGITRTGASSGKSVLHVDGATLTLTKIGFNGNNVSVDADSSIISIPSGTLNVNADTVIQKAKAKKGAAIHAGSSTATGGVTININGAQLLNNEATEDSGGAIYANKNTTITITGSTFNYNKAAKAGGAIAMYGTKDGDSSAQITISNSTFIGNEAKNGAGGAIRISEKSNVTLNGNNFTENKASGGSGEGGAVAVLSAEGNNKSTLTVNGGGFSKNEAGKDGGAIKMGGYGTLTITNRVEMRENTAKGNGGAICLAPNASARETDLLISQCSAANGGGIYIDANASFVFTGGELENCSATGNGGGVYNAGTLTMEEDDTNTSNLRRGTFEGCSAKNGGGIYTTGSVTMTGGAIEHCTATGNGGGLYVNITDSSKKVQMSVDSNHPGVINDCSATDNGGGIYIESGELDLNGGTLKMCTANNGGGIYNNGKLIVDGTSDHPGTIEDCWATNNGGAIYDNSSTQIEIHGITINGHVNLPAATVNAKNGGGIYLPNLGTNGVAPAALTVDSDSKLYNLTASEDGGAIYNAANARNSLTDKTTVNVKNTVIDGHYNGFDTSAVNAKRGGSIFMQSGWLTVENTTISNSTASGDGGAIYNMPPATFVANDCTVNMTGVTITNSVAGLTNATLGGGVFMKMGVLSLTNCTIEKLKAGSGAAIYARTNDSGSTAAQVTITNGTIENNTTTAAGGGAINTMTSDSALAKITFEGNTKVTGNKNSSDDTTHEHNMVLSHDANTVINSPGLGSSAKIGVYVVDTALTEGKTIFTEHGEEGDPFGTYSGSDPQNLNKFVNDRTNLTAMKGTSNNQIIWSKVPAPTGVNFRFLPWVLMALAGGALLIMLRRRRNA